MEPLQSKSSVELGFINQPCSYYTRGQKLLDKKNHGHIVSINGTKSFPKIHAKNAVEPLMLVVKPVYADERDTLHQYRLVKYDRIFYKNKSSLRTKVIDPLYYKLNEDNKYTVDLKLVVMAPGEKYKRPGIIKLKNGDPKLKKMRLSCEIFSYENGEIGKNCIQRFYSNPFCNKRDKEMLAELVGEGSVNGGTKICFPNVQDHNNVQYEVSFSKGQWIDCGVITNIGSECIWVKTPPYKCKNINEAVTVNVHIVRVCDGKKMKEFRFKYTPSKFEELNCNPVKTSQVSLFITDDCIQIERMTSKCTANGKIEAWLACTPISLCEEDVKKYIRVRFSHENIVQDVEIKQFIPQGVLIIETSLNFYKNDTKNAPVNVQIITLSKNFSHQLNTPTSENDEEFEIPNLFETKLPNSNTQMQKNTSKPSDKTFISNSKMLITKNSTLKGEKKTIYHSKPYNKPIEGSSQTAKLLVNSDSTSITSIYQSKFENNRKQQWNQPDPLSDVDNNVDSNINNLNVVQSLCNFIDEVPLSQIEKLLPNFEDFLLGVKGYAKFRNKAMLSSRLVVQSFYCTVYFVLEGIIEATLTYTKYNWSESLFLMD